MSFEPSLWLILVSAMVTLEVVLYLLRRVSQWYSIHNRQHASVARDAHTEAAPGTNPHSRAFRVSLDPHLR
jgi:hypothetical protein